MKVMKSIFLLLLSISCYSQNQIDNSILEKVEKIENKFQYVLKDKEYVIYSTPYQMHLIFNNYSHYYHFIFTDKSNKGDFVLYDFNVVNDSIKRIFKKNNYKKGFINGDSDFYKDNSIEVMNGLPTYFSLNIGYHNRYCEYFLTVFMKPIPMNLDVYKTINTLLIVP